MQIPVGDLVFDAYAFGEPDGELVLMLHGFPQSGWEWRHVWPGLVEAGYRVVAPDQRGYSPGARPEGVAAYAMGELVGDVVGLIDALGAEQAHVVGHDWGAAVAWQVAAHHPDRVQHADGRVGAAPGAVQRGAQDRRRPARALAVHAAVPDRGQGRGRAAGRRGGRAAHAVRRRGRDRRTRSGTSRRCGSRAG